MSNRNVSQSFVVSIEKISRRFIDHFVTRDKSKWVNGRPVLINGDVWCPMCEAWHANNNLCQQ